MNPAFSVVVFTAIAGMAQGLVVALALAVLAGAKVGAAFIAASLAVAAVLLVIGLGSSFLHLGRPERAWRAVMMWRTSWLSREVIVLPAFIGVVVLWWLGIRMGAPGTVVRTWLPIAATLLALLLWYCTAMIYACLRFIEEWAHPLTLVNFGLLGLSSGLLLATALASLWGETAFTGVSGPAALMITALAAVARLIALRRNRGLRHRSTLQSATGIDHPVLVQKSMGMTAGSFNTREFFHRASRAGLGSIRVAMVLFGYVLPCLIALAALSGAGSWLWGAATLVQIPGLLADRWFFFAQARHPQNLYYQVVS